MRGSLLAIGRLGAVLLIASMASCGGTGAVPTLPPVALASGGAASAAPTEPPSTPSPIPPPTASPSPTPTTPPTPNMTMGVYLPPGATIPPGRTPPLSDAGHGTMIDVGNGRVVQIQSGDSYFLPVGATITFTILDTTWMNKKFDATRVYTLAETGIVNGAPVAFVYDPRKDADGTYHLRSIYYTK